MTSSSEEQILIVESNNLSFNDITLNKFRTRLQREILLNGQHEMAILDATIPQQVFNVTESNYFVISRFGLKKRSMSKRDYVTCNINDALCYLEYTVRCTIPAGYYATVDELLVAIRRNIVDIRNRQDLQISKLAAQKIFTEGYDEKYWSGVGEYTSDKFIVSVGGFRSADLSRQNKYWYSKDTEDADDNIHSLKSLKRIQFHKESQKLVINPDTGFHPENWRTRITLSTDIANIFGYNENTILLSHTPWDITYAPYLSKISPEDTIYIYTPVINNIRVSNHESQLLRALPFSYNSSEFGSNSFIEFNNAHFVKLNTSRLLYLDFELRGVSGNLVRFEHGSKPVRLTLKIRPCQKL